ncbi:MAG: hypothetical protein M1817_006717 [Caeruleum heppii]|nr:MAG: hypothetical protein M1817_006717 [Caeruleum heppii]
MTAQPTTRHVAQLRTAAHPKHRPLSEHKIAMTGPGMANASGHDALPAQGPSRHRPSNGAPRDAPGLGPAGHLNHSRSPPNSKNTSHVPCKFFRQGTCQAGKACPFSHAIDSTAFQTPCKYFAKGNCKFGAKCALAHILPDGRRVNRQQMPMGSGHLNLGGRVNPEAYHPQSSALANSLQQANMGHDQFGQPYSYPSKDDFLGQPNHPHRLHDNIPTIETGYSSPNLGSNFGSPRDDGRLRSPAGGLSVLDAPLPASFDSNGISWIARNGPVAASVPSKFGLESPPHSFREGQASDALKNLHTSAFGNEPLPRPVNPTSSPPPAGMEPFGQRILHSQRPTKSKLVSASVPRPGAADEWEGDFAFEEDFIPHSLQELLTPQERMRRLSRNGGEEEGTSARRSLSGTGTPGEASSKVGSPMASSPSRFGALFARQKKEEEAAMQATGFGHVGSPLRNSTVGTSANPRGNVRPTSGDMSPYFASPPRQSSMSMISQQLQRTRLARAESGNSDSGLHPSSARHSSNPNGRMDRAVSSTSVGGRSVPSIDEEQGEVFSMEEEEDTKRHSGGFGYPTGGRSPRLNAIGAGRSGATIDGKETKGFLESLYGNGT